MLPNRSHLPSADRVGMLTASILLTYALTHIIQSPRLTLTVTLPGFYFAFPLTLGTALTVLAAALAGTGMDWLARSHPALGKTSSIEHLLLPTLTTFVIGVPLGIMPAGAAWWIGFGLGGVLLAGAIAAEYISVDPAGPAYGLARAGLTALAYVMFLILATALRFAGARMVVLVPLLFLGAALISLRILYLDGTNRWDFPWALGVGIICAQVGAGLHYWPLAPVQFGLPVTGLLYALTMLSMNLNTENLPLRRAAAGPLAVLALAWAATIFLA
jgi:hypothetical protein